MAEPASMLPWIWIIETIASHKEVEASFLYDLIEMAPELPDDLGQNMREIVALRCLEGLYSPSNGSTNKVSLGLDSKVRFDPSESCEDVLRCILGKTPVSNLRMAAPELLKWDVHSFIMHKRASMPKCALQQLKETILEGTHLHAASLKGISGLTFTKECETIPSDDGDCNALIRRLKSGNDAQNKGEKGNLVPQILEDGYKELEEVSHNFISLSSKRDRIELAAEKVVGHVTEDQNVVKAKKLKLHHSSGIPSEDESCQNLTNGEIKNDGMYPTEPQTFSGAPLEEIHHEINGPNGTYKHGFQVETPNNASHDDCREAERSKRINVGRMKNQFLNSQFTVSHDSSEIADWTEQNLCVKCREGGQLLVCNTRGCPLVVHANCLGSSFRFDNQGKFYCPFCSYSTAISEYLEAKKKLPLSRKRLASFIGSDLEHWSRGPPERLHNKEGNSRQGRQGSRQGRQGEDEDSFVVKNRHLGEIEGDQVNPTRENVNEVNNPHVENHVNEKQYPESSAACANVNLQCREEANVSSRTRTCHVSAEAKEGEDMMVQGCPDIRGTEGQEGQEGQVPADHRFDNGKVPCKNKEVIHMNQRRTEMRIMQEETFDHENDKFVTFIDSKRCIKQETNNTYPAIPQLQRKRLPFTAKEEEMIREGVSRFSNGNDGIIPWNKILEFGANVFLKGRKATDLKDKWRNMCKGSAKSK